MPKWDGSFYGELDKDDVILKDKVGNTTIKLIRFKTTEEWCYTKRTNDDFVCFYDECKTYFGLIKQGTHMIKICNTKYLVCRYRELEKVNVSEYKKYEKQIAKILVYKRMLSVSESLKDIYHLGNGILDLSFGKFVTVNKMRNTFIDKFFPKFNTFNNYLFKKMIKQDYYDKMKCYSDIVDDLESITGYIDYSFIGCEQIAQFIYNQWS